MRTTVQRDCKSRRQELQVCLCLSMCTAPVNAGRPGPRGLLWRNSAGRCLIHSAYFSQFRRLDAGDQAGSRPGQDALPKDASLCSSWQKELRRQAAIHVTKSNREIQRNPECSSGEREKTRATDPGWVQASLGTTCVSPQDRQQRGLGARPGGAGRELLDKQQVTLGRVGCGDRLSREWCGRRWAPRDHQRSHPAGEGCGCVRVPEPGGLRAVCVHVVCVYGVWTCAPCVRVCAVYVSMWVCVGVVSCMCVPCVLCIRAYMCAMCVRVRRACARMFVMCVCVHAFHVRVWRVCA